MAKLFEKGVRVVSTKEAADRRIFKPFYRRRYGTVCATPQSNRFVGVIVDGTNYRCTYAQEFWRPVDGNRNQTERNYPA